jgi:hypothetical protein
MSIMTESTMTGKQFWRQRNWNLACSHADLFAAIAPISGGNPSETQLHNLIGEGFRPGHSIIRDSVTSPSGQIPSDPTN